MADPEEGTQGGRSYVLSDYLNSPLNRSPSSYPGSAPVYHCQNVVAQRQCAKRANDNVLNSRLSQYTLDLRVVLHYSEV